MLCVRTASTHLISSTYNEAPLKLYTSNSTTLWRKACTSSSSFCNRSSSASCGGEDLGGEGVCDGGSGGSEKDDNRGSGDEGSLFGGNGAGAVFTFFTVDHGTSSDASSSGSSLSGTTTRLKPLEAGVVVGVGEAVVRSLGHGEQGVYWRCRGSMVTR